MLVSASNSEGSHEVFCADAGEALQATQDEEEQNAADDRHKVSVEPPLRVC